MTMTLVETITVGSGGAASIEFTGIPQDGKDLQILMSFGSNFATVPGADYCSITFNSDTGSNYPNLFLYGDGSTAASFGFTGTASRTPWFEQDASGDFGNMSCYISNYASSSAKSISYDGVSEQNATAATQALVASGWTGTDAITSIQISPVQGTLLVEHSTASLYIIS